jgi:hypothetical protein
MTKNWPRPNIITHSKSCWGIKPTDDKVAADEQNLALTEHQTQQLNALLQQRADNDGAATLEGIAAKEAASQQELDLGNITQQQHLANLKQFAGDRLAVEMGLLEQKRKLLGDDKLALEQNLEVMKALQRNYERDVKALKDKAALDDKTRMASLFQPLEKALDQSVNGVLTGQQTRANAARNAAQSVIVTYLSVSIATGACCR